MRANSCRGRLVHAGQILATGISGKHNEGIFVEVSRERLVDDLVPDNPRIFTKSLGCVGPKRAEIVQHPVLVVVEVLIRRCGRLGNGVHHPSSTAAVTLERPRELVLRRGFVYDPSRRTVVQTELATEHVLVHVVGRVVLVNLAATDQTRPYVFVTGFDEVGGCDVFG